LGAKTSGEGSQSWRPIVTSEHGNRIACSADASRTPTPTLPLGTGRGGRNKNPHPNPGLMNMCHFLTISLHAEFVAPSEMAEKRGGFRWRNRIGMKGSPTYSSAHPNPPPGYRERGKKQEPPPRPSP
jgi:hypothetical protein